MTNNGSRTPPRLAQLPTGVPGLDTVLHGGIPIGSVVLVAGTPGTGKTTLGNQLAHVHAAAGGTAVFATAMAETHDRMLAHLAGFGFFDDRLVGRGVKYLNVLTEVREGIDALGSALLRIVREHQATLVVLDGTTVVADLTSLLDFRQLVNRLQAQSALLGCTTVLLINRDLNEMSDVATAADGLIELRQELIGSRRARTLQVVKLRGVNHLGGYHEFVIGAGGIVVFPRLEAVRSDGEPPDDLEGERLGFGVPTLDAMLGGGLLPGSSTLLLGTPGAGKTLTGLHFLVEGARRGERGFIAGFHESPRRLIRAAARVGLDIGPFVERGLIRILWRPPLELSADAWAWDLLTAVAADQPVRLVVDAITDVERGLARSDRAPGFVAAFVEALRRAGVTVLVNAELGTLAGPELPVPLPAITTVLDTLILLRSFESGAQLHRLVSVLKERESAFDPVSRSFTIGEQGIAMGERHPGVPVLTTPPEDRS
jgi:circadian clock protein KaiC